VLQCVAVCQGADSMLQCVAVCQSADRVLQSVAEWCRVSKYNIYILSELMFISVRVRVWGGYD